MSDMRLIVVGAGGRMGRTLISAIAATNGVALAGAIEAAGLVRDQTTAKPSASPAPSAILFW